MKSKIVQVASEKPGFACFQAYQQSLYFRHLMMGYAPLHPSYSTELLLRKEATETRGRENIGMFEGADFASHGIYDSLTPLFSSLKLTRDSANDGNLTANEVFSLNLKASIIMMSACQTGLGKLLARYL